MPMFFLAFMDACDELGFVCNSQYSRAGSSGMMPLKLQQPVYSDIRNLQRIETIDHACVWLWILLS